MRTINYTDKNYEYLFFISGIIGIGIGIFIGILIVLTNPPEFTEKALNQYKESIDLIEQCEKELPRNQHCEIEIKATVKRDAK